MGRQRAILRKTEKIQGVTEATLVTMPNMIKFIVVTQITPVTSRVFFSEIVVYIGV